MIDFIENNKNNPNICIVKFEDLVGEQGGGNTEIQKKEIEKITNFMKLSFTSDKIDEIGKDLFGLIKENAPYISRKNQLERTFRKGQINSWKEYFTDEIMNEFNAKYGELQKKLGY